MSALSIESLKETANQLAHLIMNGSSEKEKIQELERKLDLITTAPDAKDKNLKSQAKNLISTINSNKKSAEEEKLGIWVPRFTNGRKSYIRDSKYKKEFDKWARVPTIPPKSSKKRIVYLGESVSRGYLLDPFYTPASVLESLLNSRTGLLQSEVIDLARTDCTLELLMELCNSCLALEPDLMVIFAGNNWLKSFELSGDLLEEMAKVMETEERFNGLKRILETQYKKVVASFMKHVDTISRAHLVQVVYIIPEFNLSDFYSNQLQQINLWTRGETGEWLNIKKEIELALKEEDTEKAELLGHQLIKLNEANPYGFELIAGCRLKRKMVKEAAEFLRQSLDTAMYRRNNVPCCISVIRRTLLEEASRYKIPVVDLPEVFFQNHFNRLPDRELFLDYCHLSVKGIQIAMAAAAQKVFSLLIKKDIPIESLLAIAPKPTPDVAACSHFFAAIHNSHRGEQPYEILYYHCSRALEESQKIKNLMLNYMEMATVHTPWELTRGCERLFESGEMDQFPYIMQLHNHYIMDIQLVDAMAAALKEHGIDVTDQVAKLRIKEHGIMKGKIDLLESYYHLNSYVASYRFNNGYYRAIAPQSSFFLVGGKEKDVQLNLECRVPAQSHKHNEEGIGVEINGYSLAVLPASHCWENFSLLVSTKLLKEGTNKITIHWPPVIDYRKMVKTLEIQNSPVDLFENGMYPHYGEINMFTAQPIM